MSYTAPHEAQFVWKGTALVHEPTGARFTVYPNGSPANVSWSRAGDRLPNGEDYDRDALLRMATALMAKKTGG